LIGLPFFDSPKNFSSRLCSLVILMFFWPPSIQFSPSYINIFCGKGSAQVINRFHTSSWFMKKFCSNLQWNSGAAISYVRSDEVKSTA
jgi:hypothetical protein